MYIYERSAFLMGWDTIVELIVVGAVVIVLLYGISWWRGSYSRSSSLKGGTFFRLVNRKVGGLFGRAVK